MKKDKILHFLVGLIISFIVGLWSPFVGLLAGILAGGIKEVVDFWLKKQGKKATVDFYDFIITALGSIVGFIILFL